MRRSSSPTLTLVLLLAGAPACSGSEDAPPFPDSMAGDPSSGDGDDDGDTPPSGDGDQPPGGDGDPGDGDGSGDGDGGGDGHDAGMAEPDPEPAPNMRLIAYLPTYRGSWSDWAERIDFDKMTHLNLSFANPDGDGEFHFGDGQSDEDVAALVKAAHAAGTKVLASLGGGGGDQILANGYEQHDRDDLVDKLDQFVAQHDLDGVDVDMEAPGRMHEEFVDFVDKTVAKLRPQGKLITSAIAPWVQNQLSEDVTQRTLTQYDFVNIMSYSNMNDAHNDLDYYDGLSVPREKMVLGVKFFGNTGNEEWDYSRILELYPDAWMMDEVHDGGRDIYYVGVGTMAKLAALSQEYGGVMFWELGEDVSGEHSLYRVLQDAF